MIEKPVLQKLLPLPYVPKEWQLKGARWWFKWRMLVVGVLTILGYAAIHPYVVAWMDSLPVLAQQLVGLLFLAAMIGFSLWYYWQTRHPFSLFMAAGYIAAALVLAGVWPAVTLLLTRLFIAAMFLSLFDGPMWQFVQNRRRA